jgi:hypothetical protein
MRDADKVSSMYAPIFILLQDLGLSDESWNPVKDEIVKQIITKSKESKMPQYVTLSLLRRL